MAVFCPEHLSCEAPISAIISTLADNDPLKFEEISNEFKLFEFHKVKDLANATFGKLSSLKCFGDDPFKKLYKAIEIYEKSYADRFKAAKLEYEQKNFSKVQEICKGMLMDKPTDLNCLMLLSASYFYCEDYDTSMSYLKEANDKNPNCAEILNNLGLCCYYSNSQCTEAFNFFIDSLNQDTANVDTWINCAKLFNQANKKQEAVTAYKMILWFKPELYVVRNDYAQLLFSLNEVEEAEKQFKIATKIAPEYLDTWNNLGNMYKNVSKIKEAIVCYNIVLESNHTSAITWYNLGTAQLKLKEYQNAIESFQTALKLRPDDIDALKNLALAYSFQQNWLLVVDSYKKVLELQPDDLDSKLQLGLVYYNFMKDYQEAEKYFENILELNPQEEEFHFYLIGVYQKQDKLKSACEAAIILGDLHFNLDEYEKAKTIYKWALYLDPSNPIGHWKLGNAMLQLGYYDIALTRYKMAVEIKPNFSNAYSECGFVYEKMNLPEKALDYYEAARALNPNNIITLQNLAFLKEKLGNFDDAVKLYYIILEHEDIDDFEINCSLANILYKEIGNFDDALVHYKKALVSCPSTLEFKEVCQCMGRLLIDMNKKEDALIFFDKVIELYPQCIETHTYIGSIHKHAERFIEAINSYNAILEIKPNFPDAFCNLVQCSLRVCDWSDYENQISKLIEIVTNQLDNDQVPSLLPHDSLSYPFSPEVLKKIASKYAVQCINKANQAKKQKKVLQSYVHQTVLFHGRIRVGYVSSDFGDHLVAQLLQSIQNFHNRNKIEVFCYMLSSTNGSSSWPKISTESDHYKDISELNVVDAANLINNDGIHILINLNGYTKDAQNEIFALKPAPIQVLWLGYPSTSGATFIDYLITDQVCSPPELKHYYTEKLAYMNRSVYIGNHKQMFSDLSSQLICDQNRDDIPLKEKPSMNNGNIHLKENCFDELVLKFNSATSMYSSQMVSDGNVKYFTRQMCNLPEDVTIFCNFSQLYKIKPSTLRMWAEILNNVPNSILWLLRFPSSGEHNIRKSAASLNIDSSRIYFSDIEKKEEHLLRIQLADVYLDTPGYNSHTTCLDVLWAGIPVITFPGKILASRVAASQLTTLGCTETIAQNEEDYINKAIQLGSDITSLDSIKAKICSLKTESKLFDCQSYTEELELIYQDMWNNFSSDQQLTMKM